MITIKTMTTEDIINAYLKHVYDSFGGITYILRDRGGDSVVNNFTRLYTSPYTPMGNPVIERTHSFLKASLQKVISNHSTHWRSISHLAVMSYHVFLHSSSEEALFYLIFRQDAYLLTLLKLLLPKIRYMGDEKCRIYLDSMTNIYTITMLNLIIVRAKCPSPIKTLMKLT